MIYKNIFEVIGNTPIVELNNIWEEGESKIYGKLEFLNPSSSIKDRAAYYMIKDAEEQGVLKPGGTIIEPTSGNTGIGLAMLGAAKGYKVILTMPETMSEERQKLIKAYGAEILLTDGSKGMAGSVELAEKLSKEKGYFLPNQFGNKSNRKAHYETTGEEILRVMGGKIDVFIAGVGTGGTVSGIGRKLKEENDKIKVIAIEPATSKVLLEGEEKAGPHKIQGIGANFEPEIFDREVIDEIIAITDEEAYKYSRLLATKEGILVGISAGANLAGAKKIAKKIGVDKNIVTVFPDTGERYLSTDLYIGK